MTNQASLSKYSLPATAPQAPATVSQKVCKRCKHLTKKDGLFYCKLLSAFLADQTLSQPCDLLEVQK